MRPPPQRRWKLHIARSLSAKPVALPRARACGHEVEPDWVAAFMAEMEARLTVVVIGNATVDLSYDVPRLPGAGETVLARAKRIDAGGKGLNQAIVARRGGAEVVYCAPLGRDASAEVILERLETEGLEAAHLWRLPVPTDESLIFVAPSGENAIVSTAAARTPWTSRRYSLSWPRSDERPAADAGESHAGAHGVLPSRELPPRVPGQCSIRRRSRSTMMGSGLRSTLQWSTRSRVRA